MGRSLSELGEKVIVRGGRGAVEAPNLRFGGDRRAVVSLPATGLPVELGGRFCVSYTEEGILFLPLSYRDRIPCVPKKRLRSRTKTRIYVSVGSRVARVYARMLGVEPVPGTTIILDMEPVEDEGRTIGFLLRPKEVYAR